MRLNAQPGLRERMSAREGERAEQLWQSRPTRSQRDQG